MTLNININLNTPQIQAAKAQFKQMVEAKHLALKHAPKLARPIKPAQLEKPARVPFKGVGKK